MAIEVCSYRLSYKGKPVGSQSIHTQLRGQNVFLESKVLLQGSLGKSSVHQKSKVHREQLSSFYFNEETQEGSSKRQFNVTFDYNKGLVRASRSGNDQAEIPLALAYSDPLSLIYHLRQLKETESFWCIPMLGKEVKVERIAEKTLDTILGKKEAFVYKLWPGGSYVYIAKEAPNIPLLFTQRFDDTHIDAHLIKVAQEAENKSSHNQRRQRKPNKSRNNRRRPRKPNQAKSSS